MAQVTNKNIEQFIKAYEVAKLMGEKQFVFDGHDVLVTYAKHVIDYFASKGYPK